MEAPFCKPSPFPKSVKYAERPFVKSPHCLEKTSSLKRISNAKFSSSFLSSRCPCFSQNSCLPALPLFSSNDSLLPTLLSFFRAPECALFPYLFFKVLLPSRRPRLPGAALLSCRYPCLLAAPASRRPCPLAASSSLSPYLFSRREKSIFSFIKQKTKRETRGVLFSLLAAEKFFEFPLAPRHVFQYFSAKIPLIRRKKVSLRSYRHTRRAYTFKISFSAKRPPKTPGRRKRWSSRP